VAVEADTFKMVNSSGTIRKVLLRVQYCIDQHIEYTGDLMPTQNKGHSRRILDINSVEAQILADTMELGLGLREADHIINEYRSIVSKLHVSVSIVYNLHRALEPAVSSIAKHKQGNADKGSPWAKARFKWTRQLAIRLGAHVWDSSVDGPCPPYFGLANLTPIVTSQVVH